MSSELDCRLLIFCGRLLLTQSFLSIDMAIEPKHVVLTDGSDATVFTVASAEEVTADIARKMCEMYNYEVSRGQTFPLDEILDISSFCDYWIPPCCGIMVSGYHHKLPSDGSTVLATYFIKKNYPYGRCSHIGNAAMMVDRNARRKGIGKILGSCLLQDAKALRYTYIMLNLVFITNVASQKVWEAIGFEKIGRIPHAVKAEGYPQPVDALIYGMTLS